jgi:hypothetical protein
MLGDPRAWAPAEHTVWVLLPKCVRARGSTVKWPLFSASLKLAHADAIVQKWGSKFGYPSASLIPVGLLELACVVVYVIPRTAVLGAILVSCYLAAAFAAHIRIEDAGGSVIPILLGVSAWGGLYLRDARIRALLPVRRI